MSEYCFGLGDGLVGPRTARRAQRIAERHGARLVLYEYDGDGPRYWFAVHDRGERWDSRCAAVAADLEAAGLDIGRLGGTE